MISAQSQGRSGEVHRPPRPPLLRRRWLLAWCALLGAVAMAPLSGANTPALAAQPGDWPMYLHDASHTSANLNEGSLSSANAAQLSKTWAFRTGGAIAAGPTVVGGVAYVGSWDGYFYALNASTGQQLWRTFLGQTNNLANCDTVAGITSTATVSGGIVYVGGGDSSFYALDAGTGTVLWQVFVGDNSPASGHYNWSSPLLYHGNAYVGVASFCDTPLVQGQLLQIGLSGGHSIHAFNVVAAGQVGGGIWTSPAVDSTTNTIFVDTGNEGGADQPYARAILALDADSLAVTSVWQLPPSGIPDPDWGTAPVLFTDAHGHQLVEASNKDGFAYAFDRNDVAAGPVWQTPIAWGGPDPEGNGDGSVSSVAFDGTRLYAAGGRATIGTTDVPGSVQALDPATGTVIWRRAAPGIVLPALSYANGVLVDGAGHDVEVLNASNGTRLFHYTTGGVIYGPAAISGGSMYIGSTDDSVYAFALPNTTKTPTPIATPSTTPTMGPTPTPSTGGGQCAVAYAIDGETVQCGDGSRVRFVGVASPLGADPGASWATALTNWLLTGRTITLEPDATTTDQFGSRYGYPHLIGTDGNDYNLSVLLIYVGMAHHLYDGVNVRYDAWLDAAQAWARTACWNMWAAGNPFAGESGCH